jgi:threonyl-tRNA synthetase
MKKSGVRVKIDDSDNTIGKKIRVHRKMRPAYMAIIGDDEVENITISVRSRRGAQKNGIPLDGFISEIVSEINNRDTILGIVPAE